MHVGKQYSPAAEPGQKVVDYTCKLCTCSLPVESASASFSISQLQMSHCIFSNAVSLFAETASMSNYVLKRVLQLNVAPKQPANSFRYHRFYISNKLKWYSVIKNHHQFLVSNLCTVSSHDCSPKRVVVGWLGFWLYRATFGWKLLVLNLVTASFLLLPNIRKVSSTWFWLGFFSYLIMAILASGSWFTFNPRPTFLWSMS